MDTKKLTDALNKAMEEKGKKKFKQSVEIIINIRSVDLSKSENRLNLDILLPKGKGGKELKSAVFADGPMAEEAKKAGADLVITPPEHTVLRRPSQDQGPLKQLFPARAAGHDVGGREIARPVPGKEGQAAQADNRRDGGPDQALPELGQDSLQGKIPRPWRRPSSGPRP